jgi:hypothetical protein
MTEHQWELYRLSVVETWPDSPYKAATIAGIQHKLAAIEYAEAPRSDTRGNRKPEFRFTAAHLTFGQRPFRPL